MSNNKFHTYRYERNYDDNHRGEAITYSIRVDHKTSTMKFAYSICNYNDNFSYKTGRDIADKRFNSGECLLGLYDNELPLKVNCEIIANNALKKFGDSNVKLLLKTIDKIR